ncbi:hypothetical protein GR160_16425 [Flavobacterium sp. Sd200]|uniref:hypothetical protein n=1 Tax=Flavobacterium sp. Sd200 TaxID=2692211 RepID=UPI00136A8E92|nr:hypothetical protein [Flavobacterium sp. Sd200]MXN92814.1 hypothetical protein [Flavobacterium sp. Sd200]
MDIEVSKLELIEMLIHTSKESVLSRVRAILEEEQQQFTGDESFYAMLDERRERHEKGESKSFTWEEIKKDLLGEKKGLHS